MECAVFDTLGQASRISSGKVCAILGDKVLLRCEMGLVKAKRAQGCLLAPAVGDLVLYALLGSKDFWILSVLERFGEEAELCLPQKTRVEKLEKLSLKADEVELEAGSTTLKGESLRLEEGEVTAISKLVNLTSQVFLQAAGYVHSFAAKVCTSVASCRNRFGKKIEEVEGLASRTAGRVREESRGSYRVRAENADVRAKEQVDIDAQHIKVG